MSKFCTGCGKEIPDGVSFCTECGKPQNTQQQAVQPPKIQHTQPRYTQPEYIPSQQAPDSRPPAGSQYEPVSTGQFIGMMLLMCIPVIGIILTAIWALSGKKINQHSFARATLVVMAIMLVISILIGMAVGKFVKNMVNEIKEELNEHTQQLDSGVSDSNSDSPLGALDELTGILGALTGDENNGIGQLLENVDEINQEAARNSDGWPKSLRKYPGGKMNTIENYRTEITGTTKDEMLSYIEDLKKDGFEYTDFYDFGMTEDEMLGNMYGWWATDGKLYLSVSYAEGIVTVDHTYELPDIESYFK